MVIYSSIPQLHHYLLISDKNPTIPRKTHISITVDEKTLGTGIKTLE